MITITAQPTYMSPLYNPIKFTINNSEYTLGTMHYCDIYVRSTSDVFHDTTLGTLNGDLVATLNKNGDGLGNCTFDVSNVLATRLSEDQVVPNSTDNVQHDFSSYLNYYVKCGTVAFVDGKEVKTEGASSTLKWAWRGALPLDGSANYEDYYARYNNTYAKFLTNSPNRSEIRRDETTFLSAMIPLKTDDNVASRSVALMANFYFTDGTSLMGQTVRNTNWAFGHILTHNARPDRLGLSASQLSKLDRMDLWLEYGEVMSVVANWQFDTSTIKCEQNDPRSNSNRVALKLDVNPNSPTYSTYQGGNTNFQFYDTNATLCPVYVPPPINTTPDWQWDTSTIKCQHNGPRPNSNRVALKLDVNPNSPTYSTYQGGATNFQFYDTNATLCPVTTEKNTMTIAASQTSSNFSSYYGVFVVTFWKDGVQETVMATYAASHQIQVDNGTQITGYGYVEEPGRDPVTEPQRYTGGFSRVSTTGNQTVTLPTTSFSGLTVLEGHFVLSDASTGGGGGPGDDPEGPGDGGVPQ